MDSDAGLEPADGLFSLLLLLFLEQDTAVENDILVLHIELDDQGADLLPDQCLHGLGVAGAATGRRQKGTHADVDRHASLDDLADRSRDGRVVLESHLELRPVLGPLGDDARESQIAVRRASCDGAIDGIA